MSSVFFISNFFIVLPPSTHQNFILMRKTLVLLTGILFLITHSNAQVISDFEIDDEGWYSEGDGDYEWEMGTGNPGNNFRVNDDATGDINLSYAPLKFLGDWSGATISDSISVDIYLNQINGGYSTSNFVFQIEGPGGVAKALEGTDPPFYVWTNYSVTFDPANWNVLSGTWEGILQNVNELIVRMEYINGDEWNRIDNFMVSFTPIAIPIEPVICSDFEDVGYDGWSFTSSGSVSNQSSGGNPGRYIRINDGASVSLANCPPKFLGDWSLLDNHTAEIQVDLNIISGSGNTYFHDFFVKIEGPGGEAIFPISNTIDSARGQWYTFAFPIDVSYWTINSGTWSGILNNVNKLTLVVEYIDGTEVVGLDNFCITDLPPVADFIADKVVRFPGEPIQFTDLSTSAPSIWAWDFGDGQSSNLRNPEVTYNTPGLYDISLTATNSFGTDSETKVGFIEIVDPMQCLKFEDDFDDNIIHPLWSFKNGSWSESSAVLRQTSNHYTSGDYLDGCFAVSGSSDWQDYILSCDFRSTDNDIIGFVFNYQDEENMYMFRWRLDPLYRGLYKYENGIETVLASDTIGYSVNDWYHADIFSLAGEIVLAINGIEIFSVYDDTFLTGKAGPYCWGNQSSYFDNYQVECPGTPVEIGVFLEGPYSGSEMQTTLQSNTLLPTINPYTTSPWNHTGTEGVLHYTNPDVVDWIMVDFRDAISASDAIPATSIKSMAAMVLKNGELISPYGGLPLFFNEDINNDLYVAIYHRNHLGVLSANALIENGGMYAYDFTSGSGQAHGTNAQKDLGNGLFGLYAGDLNADGTVDVMDKNVSWGMDSGHSGYLPSDSNLNGQADNPDKNDIWLENLGKESQLPD